MANQKVYLNEEEKEQFCLQASEKINELKEENRSLKKKYKVYEEGYVNLKNKFSKLKEDYKNVILLNLGKGDFYPISIKPVLIEARINNIKADIYDYYKEIPDENAIKKKEGLIPALEEDLEEAELKAKELEEFCDNISVDYIETSNDLKTVKKILREISQKYNSNEKKINELLALIQKEEKLYEKLYKKLYKKEKKISKKLLNIK